MAQVETIYEPHDIVYTVSAAGIFNAWHVEVDGTLTLATWEQIARSRL